MKSLISPIIHAYAVPPVCYSVFFYCDHVRILPKYDKNVFFYCAQTPFPACDMEYVYFIVYKPPPQYILGFYCTCTYHLPNMWYRILLCTYHLPNMWYRFLLCTYHLPNIIHKLFIVYIHVPPSQYVV